VDSAGDERVMVLRYDLGLLEEDTGFSISLALYKINSLGDERVWVLGRELCSFEGDRPLRRGENRT
jgi:hypothetical protein